MRLARLAPLLALAATSHVACSSTPPPAPPDPSPPAATHAPAAAPASQIKLLGMVGEVAIASFPPTGFDKLTADQRVLAYHLAQATLAGDPLFTMQTSRWAWPITQAVVKMLKGKDKLDPAFAEKLASYRRRLFLGHGIHDGRTGQKFVPDFAQKDFEAAAKTLSIETPKAMLEAMFDAKLAPNLTNKTPGEGKDPILASAANHYEGVTSKDLEGFKDAFELNSRVVKEKGKIVEQVYRAGGDGAPPGLGDKELGRVVKHLEAAAAIAPAAQKAALGELIHYFRTGDNKAFEKHDIAWLGQVFPVDYILGFVETYTDVRGRKGSFEGFIAIPDPDRDPPLQALAKSAQYFEQKLPWEAKWKRESFRVPAAAAVTVLAAAGDGGPFTFLGVNLPNGQEVRQKYGSKNFVVLSVGDSREELLGAKMIDEFAPEEARAELHRCARYLDYAATAFHEVTGHGSGKVDKGLSDDPAKLLAPYYSTMEEGRAELVADWLTGDPKTVEIGLLPDAGCAKIFPQAATTGELYRLRAVPEGDVAEEDHLRAMLIAFGYTKDKGAIAIEERGGKTFFVVKDPDAWRKARGELLAEHQRIKATGDKAALKVLVDKYGTHINTKWRDEVLKRLKGLGLPRGMATIPPILTPVKDASGKIVDVKAEQTTSLDAYVEMLEKASMD